jgi:hypothetical protein
MAYINDIPVGGAKLLNLYGSLDIACNNCADIRHSLLTIGRSEQLLIAQNGALKSLFSLNLIPFSCNTSRSFNNFLSMWNTSKSTQSFVNLMVTQSILPTDGTISFLNRFGWQNNYSEFNDTSSKAFSNNL